MGNIREQDINGTRVKAELEAEDTLAVRLQRLQVEGPPAPGPARPVLEKQARTIVDEVTYLGGPLGVVEVDAVSNAVQIRSKKPEAPGKFVEAVLRGGNRIDVEARGGAIHVSRENYEKLVGTLSGLVEPES